MPLIEIHGGESIYVAGKPCMVGHPIYMVAWQMKVDTTRLKNLACMWAAHNVWLPHQEFVCFPTIYFSKGIRYQDSRYQVF